MLLDKLAHVLRTEANAPSKTDAMKLTPGDQAVEASRRYAQKLNDLALSEKQRLRRDGFVSSCHVSS
jgi:hypothetical protein